MNSNKPNTNALPSGRVLLAICLVLSCALVFGYSREDQQGPLHMIQNVSHSIAAPFGTLGATAASVGESAAASLDDLNADPETLSQLKEQNAQLRNLVSQTEEYRQEVDRLSELLKIQKSYHIDGVAGRVIGASGTAWNQTVTIDLGSNSGIDAGQTVMGPAGVIGQVVAVGPTSSTVRLLTDPQSGVAAMVQSTRKEGIVRGSLEGLLYLENMDVNATVQVGDVIVTSGMGGSYARGLLVGTVVKVDQVQGEESRRIVVSPNTTSGPLSEVIVVKGLGTSTSDSDKKKEKNDETQDGGEE